MSLSILPAVLILDAAVGTTDVPVSALLPEDQIVEFKIRETPGDPQSVVVFVISLELTAVDSDVGQVGWELSTIEFRRPGGGGGDSED